ncbi:MAG: restriction endonuclease subunit S, partial [Marinomonas sp.]
MAELHSPEENNLQQLITEHIDLWTGAVKDKSSAGRGSRGKRELYGIKKLRELILELAVRGKLVSQDPSDEPASELLKRIAAEKAELVKQGKIKKPKKLPEIGEDEKSFALPDGWEWCYLSDVSSYIQRGKGPKYADSGSVRVISQKCIQNTGFDVSVARYVTDNSLESYQPERFLRDCDILWNSTGTGTVGRANVIRDVEEDSLVADSHVTVIRLVSVDSQFMWSFISAPFVQTRIEPTHENSLVSGSTKQVELNTSSVQSLLVPIAPLAEQHRIVAKVDELMALCDQLEQQTESSLGAHQTLVQTLLDTLLQSFDAEELEQNWQRLSAHFDLLFTTEQSIDQLKQTILQLAVMGKLVPQDPNDEPASELLKRIAAEKEELVKQKKIKKQKPLPPISDDEKPFQLPEGWEWCRADDICYGITSGST